MMSGEKDLSLVSMRLIFVNSVRPCAFSDIIFILINESVRVGTCSLRVCIG